MAIWFDSWFRCRCTRTRRKQNHTFWHWILYEYIDGSKYLWIFYVHYCSMFCYSLTFLWQLSFLFFFLFLLFGYCFPLSHEWKTLDFNCIFISYVFFFFSYGFLCLFRFSFSVPIKCVMACHREKILRPRKILAATIHHHHQWQWRRRRERWQLQQAQIF